MDVRKKAKVYAQAMAEARTPPPWRARISALSGALETIGVGPVTQIIWAGSLTALAVPQLDIPMQTVAGGAGLSVAILSTVVGMFIKAASGISRTAQRLRRDM